MKSALIYTLLCLAHCVSFVLIEDVLTVCIVSGLVVVTDSILCLVSCRWRGFWGLIAYELNTRLPWVHPANMLLQLGVGFAVFGWAFLFVVLTNVAIGFVIGFLHGLHSNGVLTVTHTTSR